MAGVIPPNLGMQILSSHTCHVFKNKPTIYNPHLPTIDPYGSILGAYYNLLNRDCNKTRTYMDHVVEITSHLIPITAMAIY